MGVQHLALWFGEQELISTPSSSTTTTSTSSSSLTITFKRLRPLEALTSLTLHGFNPPKPTCSSTGPKPDGSPVEAQAGGTRWNPTQEQIGTLEALYNGGTRTPNAAQIEQITAELGRYGRIEGKNVFYWFQNHKARERQRQKRGTALLALADRDSPPRPIANVEEEVGGGYHDGSCKRQCRSWGARLERQLEWEDDGTLELFPLRPEGAK